MSYREAYTHLEGQFTTVVGATVSGNAVNTNTFAAAASEVGNAELANNSASGLKVSPEYAPHLAGSPGVAGTSLYAGTSTTDGGNDAWVVFPISTPFAAAPVAIVPVQTKATANEGNTFFIPAGSITAGSFYIQSSVASTTFMYIAVGSGRIA